MGVSNQLEAPPGAKGVSRIQQLLSMQAEAIGVRASLASKFTDGDTKEVFNSDVLSEMQARGYSPRRSSPVRVTPEEQALINKDNQLLTTALNNPETAPIATTEEDESLWGSIVRSLGAL